MTDLTLVFDTETSGKLDFKAPLAQAPDLVEIAVKAVDDQYREVSSFALLCDGVFRGEKNPIPQEAINVHGITNEMRDAYGVPYKVIVALFNNLIRRAKRLVAHNTEFDYRIIKAAYMRAAADQDLLRNIPKFCTMKSTTDLCAIPGRYGNKWPNLQEAHTWATGKGFDGAHRAMADVDACTNVLERIEGIGAKLVRIND